MWTPSGENGGGVGGGGGMNWEIGIDMYTLICIKWISNKNLLYKRINKIKFKKINKSRATTKLKKTTTTNYSEVSPHTSQNGHHQNIYKR